MYIKKDTCFFFKLINCLRNHYNKFDNVDDLTNFSVHQVA